MEEMIGCNIVKIVGVLMASIVDFDFGLVVMVWDHAHVHL